MGASTEMSRLDSIPTATLNTLIEMAEGGGGNEPLICENTGTGERITLNKTFAEVKTAYLGGASVILKLETADGYDYQELLQVRDFGDDGGQLTFYGDYYLEASSQDGYPSDEEETDNTES